MRKPPAQSTAATMKPFAGSSVPETTAGKPPLGPTVSSSVPAVSSSDSKHGSDSTGGVGGSGKGAQLRGSDNTGQGEGHTASKQAKHSAKEDNLPPIMTFRVRACIRFRLDFPRLLLTPQGVEGPLRGLALCSSCTQGCRHHHPPDFHVFHSGL